MSDDGARRPLVERPIRLTDPRPDAVPEDPEAPAAPGALPSWLKLPDDRPSTLLPPWPDELVRRPNKGAALGWIDRLSLPVHIKKTHLFAFARYTGVTFTGADLAALEDFTPPPPGSP